MVFGSLGVQKDGKGEYKTQKEGRFRSNAESCTKELPKQGTLSTRNAIKAKSEVLCSGFIYEVLFTAPTLEGHIGGVSKVLLNDTYLRTSKCNVHCTSSASPAPRLSHAHCTAFASTRTLPENHCHANWTVSCVEELLGGCGADGVVRRVWRGGWG